MRHPRGAVIAVLVAFISVALAGCVPTPTSKVRDTAQVIVDQLPNSSGRESASKWIEDFEKKTQTGTGTGNVIAPTWHYGPWAEWGPSSVAYSVDPVHSTVELDIAMLQVGTGGQGLTGEAAASYMCVHVVLDPGASASMSNASCPTDVRDRAASVAPYAGMVTLDGELHAYAKRQLPQLLGGDDGNRTRVISLEDLPEAATETRRREPRRAAESRRSQ